MNVPPDFLCHACLVRPARHEDLCDVCEGDAQRSDLLQLDVVEDQWHAYFEVLR